MRTKNVTRNLRVKLESHEIDNRATRAAEAWQEAHTLSAELKEHVKEKKAVIGKRFAEHDLLQAVVRERSEEREVPCVDQYDEDLGMVYTLRVDTGEKVDERRMSEEERQTELLDGDVPTCEESTTGEDDEEIEE
jgi:hypothetical protein